MTRIEDRAELIRLLEPRERIVATIPARPMGSKRPRPRPPRLSWLGPVVAGGIVGISEGLGSRIGPLAMVLGGGVGIAIVVMVSRRLAPPRPDLEVPARAYQLAATEKNLFIGSLTRPGSAGVRFRRVPLDAITSVDIVDKRVIGYLLTLRISGDPSPFVALLPLDNSRKDPRKDRFLQALRSPAGLG